MDKKCHDYIDNLNDFLDGELDAALCEDITKHIGECKNCRIMVDSMKMTVTLCREGKEEQLPKALEAKLNNLLKQKWDKKFGRLKG